MNAARFTAVLVDEVERILLLAGSATENELGLRTPCSNWSVLDVARHVEVTPRSVANNLAAHTAGQSPLQVQPLPQDAGRGEVLESLRRGLDMLVESLARLTDETLREQVPGPVGPMEGQAALELALTELTIHRCDLELTLRGEAAIEPDVASAIVGVLHAWLLLISAAAPRPEEPLCYVLSDGTSQWAFNFDGSRWTGDECTTKTCSARGRPDRLALALAGRIPVSEAAESTCSPATLDSLKSYLPGP